MSSVEERGVVRGVGRGEVVPSASRPVAHRSEVRAECAAQKTWPHRLDRSNKRTRNQLEAQHGAVRRRTGWSRSSASSRGARWTAGTCGAKWGEAHRQ